MKDLPAELRLFNHHESAARLASVTTALRALVHGSVVVRIDGCTYLSVNPTALQQASELLKEESDG